MAEEQARRGGAVIHVSTDYVFDGRKNTPYSEKDTPNPLSVYGQSKLAGEEGIQQASVSEAAHKQLRYIILRTAWVYGTRGKSNFVKTMLRLFAERDEVRVVADQVGTPTWASDIASAIALLVPQLCPEQPQASPLTGIYNFTNSGMSSWYDFAIAIFEEAKQLGFPLKVQRIVPITTSEYPTPAQRPAYSVLSGKKVSAALGTHPPYWRDGLRQMLGELYSYTKEHS
jgi:dTDP-4-dehydrorhamnose reductase